MHVHENPKKKEKGPNEASEEEVEGNVKESKALLEIEGEDIGSPTIEEVKKDPRPFILDRSSGNHPPLQGMKSSPSKEKKNA